jgi:hypothetical protein
MAALTPAAASAGNGWGGRGSSGPVDPAIASLASDLGLSIAEAEKRNDWQQRALQLDAALRQSMADSFAGVWIDEDHGGRVQIGVAGQAPLPAQARQDIATLGLQDVADVVRVTFSWNDLLVMSPLLSQQLKAANRGSDVQLIPFFEPQYNRVALYVPQAGMTAAQQDVVAQARARFSDRVRLVDYPGRINHTRCALIGTYDCDAPLRGGVSMYINTSTFQCSTGFNVRSNSDGKWYVMTAAHCGGVGTEFWAYQPDKAVFSKIGAMHSRGDPSLFNDYGIVTINNPAALPAGWSPRPWVYVKASTGRGGVAGTTTDYDYTISGTGGSGVGNRVCAITARTGTSCGRILATGFPDPGDYAVADYCVLGGDSGGGMVNAHLALGINVGYIGSNNCGQSVYVGITEAQQSLHVHVATG